MNNSAIFLLTLSLPLVAAATENVEPADTAYSLSEVRVTAIKQASSLLRQPVSVTTVTPEEVSRYTIESMKGVSEIAPNFYMPDYGSKMTSSIYVRGIGSRIDQPAVGLNVDNIPFLNKNGYDFDMADIERIEVLRGPQSTLYGRNTIAGLINVYTLSPMNWEGVKFSAQGGSYAFSRLSAGIYKKLGDRLGMSLNVHGGHNNGYEHNAHDGARCGETQELSMRWKTVWRPTENFSLENVVSGVHSRQHGYPYAFEQTGEVNYNDTCFYRRWGLTEGLSLKWITEHFTLASITGLQMLHDNMTLDQDFLPESYFTLTQRQHDLSATQDIVLRGATGNYTWLAGVFAFYKHNRMMAPVTFKEDGIDRLILDNINGNIPPKIGIGYRWNSPDFLLDSRFRSPVKGIALYHRSAYTAGPFDLAVGLRFDYEHNSMSYKSNVNTSASIWRSTPAGDMKMLDLSGDINEAGRLSQTFREFLPTFSVTFNHNNSAFYASVSRGYKAGGYNTQMFSQILQDRMENRLKEETVEKVTAMMGPQMGQMIGGMMGDLKDVDVDRVVSYRPETSWNYEVGGHFYMDQGRAYATFSAFWIDLRDQQVTVFPDGTTTGRMTANAGRTRSLGAELTLRYAPTPKWVFNVAYGYNKATFRHFNNGLDDLSGKRVPYAPENTLFASVTFLQKISDKRDIQLIVTPDVRGTGSIYWDERNQYRQPFYAELGLNAGIKWRSALFEVWMKNITDTRFNVFRYESIGNSFFQRGAPFHWGLRVRFDLKDFKF